MEGDNNDDDDDDNNGVEHDDDNDGVIDDENVYELTTWTFQDYTKQFSVMCAGCKKANNSFCLDKYFSLCNCFLNIFFFRRLCQRRDRRRLQG